MEAKSRCAEQRCATVCSQLTNSVFVPRQRLSQSLNDRVHAAFCQGQKSRNSCKRPQPCVVWSWLPSYRLKLSTPGRSVKHQTFQRSCARLMSTLSIAVAAAVLPVHALVFTPANGCLCAFGWTPAARFRQRNRLTRPALAIEAHGLGLVTHGWTAIRLRPGKALWQALLAQERSCARAVGT